MKLDSRFIKFILVGALNTLFGLGAYALLIRLGLPVWASLIGGNVAGIFFNFVTTGHFVFADMLLRRLPRFVGAYLGLYVLNYLLIQLLHALHMGAIGAQILLTPVMAIGSFYVMSRYVFVPERVGDGQ